MSNKILKGRRIGILAADGFEKVEVLVPMKALKAAGAQVKVISLRRGKIRGMNLHEPAGRIDVDLTIEEALPSDFDGLLIPGGFINPDLLRQSSNVRHFVQGFNEEKKPIASLCHGPWVLASSGLLEGRTVTSWPGIRDDMVNAGARWLDMDVVQDGNWITSRGPQDLPVFTNMMIKHFAEGPSLHTSSSEIKTSSPKKQNPPELVLETMRWAPRPSLRTLGFIGMAAVALIGLRSSKAE